MLLENQWVNDEIKEEINKSLRQMTMKIQPYKIHGMQQKQFLEEVHSEIGLPQKTRQISNKQPNLPVKSIRKRKTNKT